MKNIRVICILLIAVCLCSLIGCANSRNKIEAPGVSYIIEKIGNVTEPSKVYSILQEELDNGYNLDLTGVEVEISKSLVVYNQDIYGGKITYVGTDKEPVMKIGGKCIIDSVTIINQSKEVGSKEGEYVGVWLSNERGNVTQGTIIQSCKFEDVGTVIYAPNDVKSAACGISVENLRAEKWSFRGIDIQSPECTNNSYSNLYLSTDKAPGDTAYMGQTPADCAFYLSGSDSDVLKQINVEHCNLKQPIVFENCNNLDASSIHVEGVNIAEDGHGYLNFYNTSGRIGAVDFYWTRVYSKNNGAVVLYDSEKQGNELIFETFIVKGINDPSDDDPGVVRGVKNCGIKLFARNDKYQNPYYITINNYVPFSFQDDKDVLDDFYSDKNNITFKKIGQLPAGGSTDERPTMRLCAGYTEFYDTTLGKLIKWNGSSWE